MTRWQVLLAMVVAAGCGNSEYVEVTLDAGGDSADAAPVELAGACELADKVGAFEIFHRDFYSGVEGKIYDAVQPAELLEQRESEAGCTLYRVNNPFCSPPCTSGNTCNSDGECVPAPRLQEVGEVTVTGLLVPVTMEPLADKRYSHSDVPNPPFEHDTPIQLHAGGGAPAGFDLHGYGVAPISIPGDEWVIRTGEPLVIEWTAAEGHSRIRATLNVDQHGNSPITMVCEFEDTGSATIPASLIATFLEYGYSGAATGHIYRQTVDSIQLAQGCVELTVLSHLPARLSIEGFEGT